MKRLLSLSLIDQALLSAASFVISLVLVKYGGPQSVGGFALALSMTFVATGVQNAMVITPAAVRLFSLDRAAQAGILATLTTVDVLLNAALTAACFGVSIGLDFTAFQSAAVALLVSSSLVRELARGVLAGCGNIQRCVVLDSAGVAVCFAVTWFLWSRVAPEMACMLGLAAGNLLSSWVFGPENHRRPGQLLHHLSAYSAYWGESRWMLMGATATELHERSYVFMLQMLRGIATVGTVHAGRFLIAPLSLMTTAWGRAMRPRMATLLENGRHAEARGILVGGVALTLALTVAYIAVLLLLWDVIDRQLFAGRYPDMWPIVLAWCGYGLLSVPANCLSFYYQAERRFQPLAVNAVWGGAGSLGFLLVLMLPVPDFTAILSLYAGAGIALAAQLKWWLEVPSPSRVLP